MTDHWHRLHHRRTRSDLARRAWDWLFWSIGLAGWALFCGHIVSLWLGQAPAP